MQDFGERASERTHTPSGNADFDQGPETQAKDGFSRCEATRRKSQRSLQNPLRDYAVDLYAHWYALPPLTAFDDLRVCTPRILKLVFKTNGCSARMLNRTECRTGLETQPCLAMARRYSLLYL